WEIKDIRDTALQFDELRVLNKKQIDDKGLQGSPSRLAIFTNEAGGGVRFSDGWAEGDKEKDVTFDFGKLLRVHKVSYDRSGKTGSLHGTAFKNNKIIEEASFKFPLQESAAVDYGGFVPSGGVTREIGSLLKAKGLSPIEIQVAELTDRGLVARGQILPTISVLRNLKINLIIDGDDIYLSRVFSAGDFKFPGPIQVTSASLEVFAGTPGIGARGDVFFEIKKLGKGKLSGKASTGSGFSVAGEFEFDTKLFDPAMVRVEYSNGKFSGSGEIGVPPGKLRGIRSANIKAAFEDERITATGSVKPEIPGIEQGDLSMSYDPVGGLMIAGSLQLKKDIPGISGGTVTAQVIKKPDADNYIVKASGQATSNIPGISASLSVSYDDGQFDVFGTVGYEKGMLKGSVSVGATNRPIGDDGKPVPGPVDKASKIILYGGGSVTIKLAPWLQATAAIKLLPNGEIEVTGSIGLPQALDLFPEKKLDRNIFKIGIDIPIVGLSVAGQRVGIFANISGGADLSAGIGPGQLRELGLSITYNPSRESETHVTGGATLHIPAHAGLRLFVRGGLGVGIPLVSATAGLEIGGAIGLEGALDAGVQVDWTPTQGLKLDAFGEISVEPKLRFDITGFVLVEFDYLIDTATLYEKRWQLAAFEYGSGLKFGVKFPVHYEEGKAFDISLSDVQFQTPDINPKELLGDLIKQIA
ncbi:MAG TPA: hypothetical protein VFV93_18660, partial [Thermomicrobiales bacterium]|nr:hypothetical protein [Thermomicrobiales bacterium]